MKNKNMLLLAGALAAGMKAVDAKVLSPTVAVLFMLIGTALAFLADAPRDPHARDRAEDDQP